MVNSALSATSDFHPLPAGWRWTRLGDVCEKKTDTRDPSAHADYPFLYVDITSVDNAAKRIIEPKRLLGKDAPSRARQVICAGDVIVSTTRPNLNAVAMVPVELNGEICSTGFCVLRAKAELEPDYLFAFVQSTEFVQALSDLVRGALYPAVTDSQVRDQWFPLPPRSEQRRIAAILNEQMAAVERARVAAEAQLAAAKELPAAYLREVFESAETKRWAKKPLGNLCEIVARQVDPKTSEYGALPHVNGENIESGTLRLKYLNTATEDKMTSGKYLFEPGDVLYSKLRPYLRKVAVVDFRGLCSADMYPIRVNQQFVDRQFMAWMLISDGFTKYADEESRRARMPKLNREQLFAWQCPLPPLAEQQRIAAILKSQSAIVQQLNERLQTQFAAINRLPAALLRRAFNGEL